MTQHLTYKFVPRTETVETALEFVREEVTNLIDECEYAASRYKLGHPKVEAFLAAARALRGLVPEFGAAYQKAVASTASGQPLRGTPLEFQMQVPRRKSHHKARWSRAGDCARALGAVAGVVEGHMYFCLSAELHELVGKLVAVQFPKLYD